MIDVIGGEVVASLLMFLFEVLVDVAVCGISDVTVWSE